MKDFAAIDFETANYHRTSVCSVGMVIVRDGKVKDEFYRLIKPYPNYYSGWATECHGLTAPETADAPLFPEAWAEIAPQIEGLTLVAHNKEFDEPYLIGCYEPYGMSYPNYTFGCTLWAARRSFPELSNHQLHTVSAHVGFDLDNHHHALADSEVCAMIAIEIL